MRKTKFQIGEYYHIFNRGVDKRDVFIDDKDYIRFIRSMREFNDIKITGSLYKKKNLEKKGVELPIGSSTPQRPLVEIICYSLLPNHYHFLLKQLQEDGIIKFLHKLGTGYSNFFNFKYKRSGSLFEGRFEDIHVKTDEYLIYLSGYINGNPEIHKIVKAEDWPWSSYLDYLNLRDGTLCSKNIILDDFKNIDEYKKYVNTVIRESAQIKKDVKKYLLE